MKQLRSNLITKLVILFSLPMFLVFCEKKESEEPEEKNPDSTVLDKTDREAVMQDFIDNYLGSKLETGEYEWTGSLEDCQKGETNDETKQKVLDRINYYRRLVGYPGVVELDPELSAKAQSAALIMAANKKLSHNPGTDWKCYSEEGANAASKSNIALSYGPRAIDAYIQDYGAGNEGVGHRNKFFLRSFTKTGTGDVAVGTSKANVLWAIGGGGDTPDSIPDYVAWPPEGYFPNYLLKPFNYPEDLRWSFSANVGYPNFKDAEVSITASNGDVVTIEFEKEKTYGSIVWMAHGIDYSSEEDITYHVEISGVVDGGEDKTFEYDVIVFNVKDLL